MTASYNYIAGVVSSGIRPLLLALAILLTACADDSVAPGTSESDVTLNNRGVALMGKFDYHGASEIFAQLVERLPDWHDVRVNYAIALKNRQQADDGQRALDQLAIVLATDPDNLRANYNAGVLQLYLGEIESATGYFKKALAVDSQDAYAHYYLGQCQLRSGDEEAALASYQRAIELDPYLRSAYYSAAQVLRRLARADEAGKELAVFQRFENNPRARLAEFKYTRMGPKSFAVVAGSDAGVEPPIAVPEGSLFADKRTIAKLGDADGSWHLSTVDIDHNGSQDLFLANSAAGESRLLLSTPESGFAESRNLPWKDVGRINAVAWGDIDNDGTVDAYLCRSGANQLWLQIADGKWKQAGPAANVTDGTND
ncbi:MAG: tetratricopeptide repeat protein, partial [Arenicella sp.]|nr:tetratricopeptide repeat protein [Arenicella sp.]